MWGDRYINSMGKAAFTTYTYKGWLEKTSTCQYNKASNMAGYFPDSPFISNHRVVHFKYFTILFVNNISIRLKTKEWISSPFLKH